MKKKTDNSVKDQNATCDNNVLATVVLMVKNEVAQEYGFNENPIGATLWDYAMIITHRTKKQIGMYDRVCVKLAHYCC